MMAKRSPTWRLLALLVLLAALLPGPAQAQTPPQASVTLDVYTVAPGRPLTITGVNFMPGVVEIRLKGALLGSAETGTGSFSRTFDVPAADLVDREAESFDLTASATGRVVAFDPAELLQREAEGEVVGEQERADIADQRVAEGTDGAVIERDQERHQADLRDHSQHVFPP